MACFTLKMKRIPLALFVAILLVTSNVSLAQRDRVERALDRVERALPHGTQDGSNGTTVEEPKAHDDGVTHEELQRKPYVSPFPVVTVGIVAFILLATLVIVVVIYMVKKGVFEDAKGFIEQTRRGGSKVTTNASNTIGSMKAKNPFGGKQLEDGQRQFGVDVNHVKTTDVKPYARPIPSVLVQLQEAFLKHGGVNTVGIFRINPAESERREVRQELNNGTFQDCNSVMATSSLIKQWVRELPESLVRGFAMDAFRDKDTATKEAAGQIVTHLPEPNQSIMLWLLDLCVEIAENSTVNMMDAYNLAVCFGPGLDDRSPVLTSMEQAMIESKSITEFFEQAIGWRRAATQRVTMRKNRNSTTSGGRMRSVAKRVSRIASVWKSPKANEPEGQVPVFLY